MHFHLIALVLAALITAVVFDLREQRIPNWLTLTLALAGIASHTMLSSLDGLGFSLDGLGFSLAGLGVGLGLMLLPYFLGVMGGGDVKLMAAVGACLGAPDAVAAFLFTSLAGGVYSLAVLAFRPGLLRRVLSNFWTTAWLLTASKRGEYAPVTEGQRLPKLCYGLAIAVGSTAAMVRAAIVSGAL